MRGLPFKKQTLLTRAKRMLLVSLLILLGFSFHLDSSKGSVLFEKSITEVLDLNSILQPVNVKD
ncbi:MAG: hypothetical protein LDL53_09325 [Candidatus Hydrogenedens sp.]|nr:hypothetical protein [Candidatus Hydrogenedens sp.]